MVFMNRHCGDSWVFCDGECQKCVLRMIKTTDGKRLYPGRHNGKPTASYEKIKNALGGDENG